MQALSAIDVVRWDLKARLLEAPWAPVSPRASPDSADGLRAGTAGDRLTGQGAAPAAVQRCTRAGSFELLLATGGDDV
jgi:hypothetical protein